MKSNLLGVALVLAGAIFLIASYIAGWTSSNLILLGGLLIIILGVIAHVIQAKKGQKY